MVHYFSVYCCIPTTKLSLHNLLYVMFQTVLLHNYKEVNYLVALYPTKIHLEHRKVV